VSTPATGRWLIVPRISTGTRRLALGLGRWLAATDLKKWARARGVLGRFLGTGFIAWFLGGMLWALGTPPWAVVPLWLGAAMAASYRDQRDAAETDKEFNQAAFIELLHDVAAGGNVHLTAVRAQLLKETGKDWDVLALCRAAGITTKAVRVTGADPAVTTGIHRTDLPPLPRGSSGTPEGVLTSNNNSNNATAEEVSEGVVIVHTGPSIRQEARR
jgi:hypothetical protein